MVDNELRRFLEEGLWMHLGVRNDRLEPEGVRVAALKVGDDGRTLTAYVPASASGRVLPQLTANRQATVVVVRPTDDRGYQLKGEFAGAQDAPPGDEPLVRAQWEGLLASLASIGIPRDLYTNWCVWPCVAITMSVNAVFGQTPGPGAGAPVA